MRDIFLVLVVIIISLILYSLKLRKTKEVEVVTPQFVYGALNSDENIILVNVLSDKLQYKITIDGINNVKSLSKFEFENLLKKNNNTIPESIKKVIIYCAAWSCSGAKNYYKKMVKDGIDVSKVVDYIGALHEWATYSKINPTKFTFHSTETGKLLNNLEVNEIINNTAHGYFVENVLKEGYIKTISLKGSNFKKYLN